jgi:hypothetical protein
MDRLDAIWMIETGGNDYTVGKAGEISRYQVRANIWKSITDSRDYSSPKTARFVASKVMDTRVRAFDAAFKRQPTNFEYYALWNAPNQILSGHRVSPAVAERCQRFSNLCARPTPGLQASR